MVGVYIDDLIIVDGNQVDIDAFKSEMHSTFKMSDLGRLHYYLGLEVSQSEEGITLCQNAYAAKILETTGMTRCKSTCTPMEPCLKLSKLSTAPAVDPTHYRSVVGSL